MSRKHGAFIARSQIAKLAKYLDIWLFGYLARYTEHSIITFSIHFSDPTQKTKMFQNGKIDSNPTGSSHGEQLEPKRLTLINIQYIVMIPIGLYCF